METTTQTSTYGGLQGSTPLRGYGFQAAPRDGIAAYPRTVLLDGAPREINGPGWVRTKARSLSIVPADPPIPSVSVVAASSESWTVLVAEDECELETDTGMRPPPSQTLVETDNEGVAWPIAGTWLPPIDCRPWRTVQASIACIGSQINMGFQQSWTNKKGYVIQQKTGGPWITVQTALGGTSAPAVKTIQWRSEYLTSVTYESTYLKAPFLIPFIGTGNASLAVVTVIGSR